MHSMRSEPIPVGNGYLIATYVSRDSINQYHDAQAEKKVNFLCWSIKSSTATYAKPAAYLLLIAIIFTIGCLYGMYIVPLFP